MTVDTGTFLDINDKDVSAEFRRRLASFSSSVYSVDLGVAYHVDPPNKVSLPQGMPLAKGAKLLNEAAVAQQEVQEFQRTFKFRPWDGAHAVTRVMQQFFGTTGRGVPIKTMFGSIPPQTIEIETAYGQTEQVPWGHLKFAHFDGLLMLGSTRDNDYGVLFQLTISCPKMYGDSVHGFFNLIETYLRENSIYKGKAIKGTDEPRFIPVETNPTIVYTEEVNAGLTNTVWGVIRNAALFLKDRRKVNKRVLLHGPYGTGKSEAGTMTAEVAMEQGWTFVQFHSGKGNLSDLEATIATARLYSPAVVFIEDIDIYADEADKNIQSRITNLFDGLGSKGDQVMILMTSNRAAMFSKGMLRAGRVDRMIEIGSLDKEATEELIRRVIGEDRLAPDIDFEKVWKAMDGYEPAFVRSTFDQAAEAAIIRTRSLDYTLDTADFVSAAHLLRPQFDLHQGADERQKKIITTDSLIREQVTEVLTKNLQGEIRTDGEDGVMTFELVQS